MVCDGGSGGSSRYSPSDFSFITGASILCDSTSNGVVNLARWWKKVMNSCKKKMKKALGEPEAFCFWRHSCCKQAHLFPSGPRSGTSQWGEGVSFQCTLCQHGIVQRRQFWFFCNRGGRVLLLVRRSHGVGWQQVVEKMAKYMQVLTEETKNTPKPKQRNVGKEEGSCGLKQFYWRNYPTQMIKEPHQKSENFSFIRKIWVWMRLHTKFAVRPAVVVEWFEFKELS